MKRLCFVMACLCFVLTATATNNKNKELYHTLDSLIEHHDAIIAEKEQRIKHILDGIESVTLNSEQTYDLNLRLYDEYVAFKFDSAFYYINKNVQSTKVTDDHERYATSAIRMAHILAVSGLFDRARHLLDNINPDELSNKQKVEYYSQQSELNLYRSEMAQFTPYFTDYTRRAQYYRQLAIQIAPKDSYEYIFNQATYLCEKRKASEAIKIMEEYLLRLEQGTRPYSVVASTLAFFHQCLNQKEQQEHYLLLSAISDERGAICENNSLRSLAEILMERGENDAAYRYLYQAISEAQFYGSRLRMMQVGRMAPQVMQLYDAERAQVQSRTYWALSVISVVSLLLLCLMVYTYTLVRKRRADAQHIIEINHQLSHRNEEIENINSQMKESNRIKDEYIGRFLELSSNLIKQSEDRAKQLNRLARDRKLDELYTELKSTEAINNGIRLFHQNFDIAFLNIYPDFITEVNKLLNPEERFSIQDEGATKHLTTELRILALIRLGIADNQEIADILRSSITTIYTYRSKIKARAIDKDTFENSIRQIATY